MRRFVKLSLEELVNLDYSQTKRVGPFEFGLDQKSFADVIIADNGQYGTISYGTLDLDATRSITYMNPDTGQMVTEMLNPGVHGRTDLIDLDTMEEITGETYENMLSEYPDFQIDYLYSAGNLFKYEGSLYFVIKEHTSSSDPNWAPDKEKTLYRITFPENVLATWVQPTGGHDAYPLEAMVKWNGQNWISNIANNVWEPGVYGWDLA